MRTIEACFVLFFRFIGGIFGFLFKHKAILVILVVCLFAFAGWNAIKPEKKATVLDTPKPSYQKIEPTKAQAKDIIIPQYGGHIYHANNYQTLADGSTILTDYYVYDKKNWKHSTIPLPIHSKVKIIHKT